MSTTIKAVSLLYQAHLIYNNGVDSSDMHILYSYLTNLYNGGVRTGKLNSPPYGRIPTETSLFDSSTFGRSHLLSTGGGGEESCFLFGGAPPMATSVSKGENRKNASSSSSDSNQNKNTNLFIPKIYLSDGSEGQVVALFYKKCLLLVIFEGDVEIDGRMLEKLRGFCCTENLNGGGAGI